VASTQIKGGLLIAVAGLAYVALSSPNEVVIDDRGRIDGFLNAARELIQGESFWEDQAHIAGRELQWELNEPSRMAELEREMHRLDADLDREMSEFYQQYPDMRPTNAERRAQRMRDRADAIEQAELDRELERLRLARIAELRKTLSFLESRSE
jgi:hypothetical protein